MSKTRKRETVKTKAHLKALQFSITVFLTIICMEIAVILGKHTKTEFNILIIAVALPLVCSTVIYFITRNIEISDEQQRRMEIYAQKEIDEENFVKLENTSEITKIKALEEKIDLLAVPGKKANTVIVVISLKNNILSIQELSVDDFKEQFNVIKGDK